jgi:hypothetical protein
MVNKFSVAFDVEIKKVVALKAGVMEGNELVVVVIFDMVF